MLSVNKAGELQISSKWVETLVANSDNERKRTEDGNVRKREREKVKTV